MILLTEKIARPVSQAGLGAIFNLAVAPNRNVGWLDQVESCNDPPSWLSSMFPLHLLNFSLDIRVDNWLVRSDRIVWSWSFSKCLTSTMTPIAGDVFLRRRTKSRNADGVAWNRFRGHNHPTPHRGRGVRVTRRSTPHPQSNTCVRLTYCFPCLDRMFNDLNNGR